MILILIINIKNYKNMNSIHKKLMNLAKMRQN